MAMILLEAPKMAMLLGFAMGYKGLSLMDFSISFCFPHADRSGCARWDKKKALLQQGRFPLIWLRGFMCHKDYLDFPRKVKTIIASHFP